MEKELFIEKLVGMKNETERLNKIKKKLKLSSTGVEKRFDFFKRRSKYIKYYNYFVEYLNKLQVPYYIKGSSAWWSNFNPVIKKDLETYNIKKSCEDVLLYLQNKYPNNIDEIASFLPQNWDFSIFVPTGYKNKIKDNLIKKLKEIKLKMNNDKNFFSDKRVLRSSKNTEQILGFEINSENEGADTFKGSYISYCRIENRQGNKYKHFNDENVCTEQIKLDQKDKIGFLLFWITIHEVPNINKFYDNFLKPITIQEKTTIFDLELEQTPTKTFYLNIDGLLLGHIYMESKGVNRTDEKQLKVDELRLNSIGIYKTKEQRLKKLKKIYEFWTQNFEKNKLEWTKKDYNKFFKEYEYNNIVNGIKKLILQNLYDKNSKSDAITYLEKSLVNNYRPVINTIIINLSAYLKKTKISGISKIDMFIVGGDAFTRYIENSKISDIDIKLQLTPEITHIKKQLIEPKIKKQIQEIIIKFLSPYIIFLNYIGKFNNGPSFRIRQFDNTMEDSPYNLFSVDCKFFRNIPDLFDNFYMEYAILDISIGYNYNKHDYKYDYDMIDTNVKINMTNYFFNNNYNISQIKKQIESVYIESKLPVATRKFLIEDLQKTYENKSAMEGRLLSGKIEKDMRRYKLLKSKINSSEKIIKYNLSDPILTWTFKYQENIKQALTFCGCLYYNMFIELYNKIKGKKRKMTYTSTGYSYCNLVFLDSLKDDYLHISAKQCISDLNLDLEEQVKNYVKIFCKVMNKNNKEIQEPFNLISNIQIIEKLK